MVYLQNSFALKMWTKLVLFNCFFALLLQQSGVHAAPGDELWNYVEVRPGAHMFWWLMCSKAAGPPESRPLIIWLTGGPGAGSTAWGNFEEVGPFDWNFKPRAITWIDHAHILFVDSPVGSGYSYVDSPDLLCTNCTEIALDLITMLKDFLANHAPELKTAPIYIFGESFGGRMGPDFAWELYKVIQSGEIAANLKGLIIRDGSTSLDDTVATYSEYMLNTGMVDKDGGDVIQYWVDQFLSLTAAENHLEASYVFDTLNNEQIRMSKGGNIYYILDPAPLPYTETNGETCSYLSRGTCSRHDVTEPTQEELIALMNGVVRDKLLTRIPFLSEWGSQQRNVYDTLRSDITRSSMNSVELILNNTNIKVAVVTGQLDLICCTPGAERWVDRLSWSGASNWKQNPRDSVLIEELIEGYVKLDDKFSFWWVNRAGHSTFYYNPQYGKYFISNFTEIPWI